MVLLRDIGGLHRVQGVGVGFFEGLGVFRANRRDPI